VEYQCGVTLSSSEYFLVIVRQPPEIILASRSPRRQQMLAALGIRFSVVAADIDETVHTGESPEGYVARLAGEKALAAANKLSGSAIIPKAEASNCTQPILAADTTVALGGTIFGKPKDRADAFRIWSALSDTTHHVYTGIALLVDDDLQVRVGVTQVVYARMDERDMSGYWASGEPQDKAGAYGAQGLGSAFVKEVHGSYSNVVGLPLYELRQLLKANGWDWI
jgi:septum formation protein